MINISAVKKIILSHIPPNKPLIVAVSGGPDSMCLLHLCLKRRPGKTIVAHLNHSIRKESDKDETFVKHYCQKHHLLFESKKVDIPMLSKKKKRSLEETARQERYAFLRQVKAKYEAPFILTAHHSDDNVETILLHFIRGAGLHGLIGMKEVSNDILRPLLSFTKKEILRYCKQKRIMYRMDKTNLAPSATRNILRLKVIPWLLKINPNFPQTLLENAAQFRDIEDYLTRQARRFLNQK